MNFVIIAVLLGILPTVQAQDHTIVSDKAAQRAIDLLLSNDEAQEPKDPRFKKDAFHSQDWSKVTTPCTKRSEALIQKLRMALAEKEHARMMQLTAMTLQDLGTSSLPDSMLPQLNFKDALARFLITSNLLLPGAGIEASLREKAFKNLAKQSGHFSEIEAKQMIAGKYNSGLNHKASKVISKVFDDSKKMILIDGTDISKKSLEEIREVFQRNAKEIRAIHTKRFLRELSAEGISINKQHLRIAQRNAKVSLKLAEYAVTNKKNFAQWKKAQFINSNPQKFVDDFGKAIKIHLLKKLDKTVLEKKIREEIIDEMNSFEKLNKMAVKDGLPVEELDDYLKNNTKRLISKLQKNAIASGMPPEKAISIFSEDRLLKGLNSSKSGMSYSIKPKTFNSRAFAKNAISDAVSSRYGKGIFPKLSISIFGGFNIALLANQILAPGAASPESEFLANEPELIFTVPEQKQCSYLSLVLKNYPSVKQQFEEKISFIYKEASEFEEFFDLANAETSAIFQGFAGKIVARDRTRLDEESLRIPQTILKFAREQ